MTKDWSGAKWSKSTYSQPDGDCVQVAILGGVVGVSDSKDQDGAVLEFTPSEWRAFVDGAKDGQFDQP